MNTNVSDYLKKAISEALTNDDVNSAKELLKILCSAVLTKEPTPQMAAPIVAAPKSTCKYWASIIQQAFIPLQINRKNFSFTATDVIAWIVSNPSIVLSDEEKRLNSKGYPYWRDRMHAGLKQLIVNNILIKEPGTGIYKISS